MAAPTDAKVETTSKRMAKAEPDSGCGSDCDSAPASAPAATAKKRKPQTKRAKADGKSSSADKSDKKESRGKAAPWPTRDKVSLFRLIWGKGRSSMADADWKQEADKQGRDVSALKDQVRRNLTADIEKCIQSGTV